MIILILRWSEFLSRETETKYSDNLACFDTLSEYHRAFYFHQAQAD